MRSRALIKRGSRALQKHRNGTRALRKVDPRHLRPWSPSKVHADGCTGNHCTCPGCRFCRNFPNGCNWCLDRYENYRIQTLLGILAVKVSSKLCSRCIRAKYRRR